MSLYLILMLVSFGSCFVLSFDKKVAFYKNIRFLIPAVLLVAIPFLIWDEFFTVNDIWGFNQTYLQGFYMGSLPLEEVLFFFLIPYCCVFIYEVLIGSTSRSRNCVRVVCLLHIPIGIYYRSYYTSSTSATL